MDVYGKGSCSDPGMTCDRSIDDKCLQMLSTSYKFYLSFENSLCEDYITEKFFKVLPYNVIPVVLNGVNMTTYAPKHSYIDIADFINTEGIFRRTGCFGSTKLCTIFIFRGSKVLD